MTGPVVVAPAANVPAPPAAPPVTGLTSLARAPEITDNRWQAGYQYLAEIPVARVRNRSAVTATVGENIGSGQPAQTVSTIPWLLEIEGRYSGFVRDRDDHQTIAARLIDTFSSKLLERELWTGEIASADNLPNRVLARPEAEIVGPAGTPQEAVAILMGALGDAGMGDGMIHAPRRLGIQLPDGWRNTQTYEDYGFVVVAGAGYPGTGPNGTGTTWMYATEIVNVRLSEPWTMPSNPTEGFDRTTNEYVFYAQRVGAVDFAGPVFACQVGTP